MTLSLISIGLADERDMSQRALEEAQGCDVLYAELYTMKLATTLAALSELTKKPVTLLPRGDLEERSGDIIEEARSRSVGVLVGGDCLSATTHISLVLDAAKRGVKTRVIHGSSIFTAVAETGLSIYKFGRTVTMPLPEKGPADTVLRGVEENLQTGLHTLILLDLDLPGMDGLALVRQLKADPDTRDIRVVAVTFYPEQYPKAAALAAGCDAYLPKPINTRELSDQLAAVAEVGDGGGQLAGERKAP